MSQYKKERPLVSILSPCWNGEHYVGRMLNSILNQTYGNIQMICIDDGSTDHTKEMILSYVTRFQEKGMSLEYLYQDNQGQAAAINKGLKRIKGEFLSWIDCDDYLTADSVEKKAELLIRNPGYDVVTSDFYKVKEENLDHIIEQPGKRLGSLNYQRNQFYLTLTGASIIECHCHMIRVSALRETNPAMNISTCREGQNYQILLPLYYERRRAYIDEPLAYYVIRKDSHYHRERTCEEWMERYQNLQNMLRETFRQMNLSLQEGEKLIKMSVFYQEQRRMMDYYGGNQTLVR